MHCAFHAWIDFIFILDMTMVVFISCYVMMILFIYILKSHRADFIRRLNFKS